jgi:hypothetical protein
MDKICGKIHLNLKAIGTVFKRSNFAVFWQSERYIAPVFIGFEKDGFTGVSGRGGDKRSPYRAYFVKKMIRWII